MTQKTFMAIEKWLFWWSKMAPLSHELSKILIWWRKRTDSRFWTTTRRRQRKYPHFPWHLPFSPPPSTQKVFFGKWGKYMFMFSESKYAQAMECLRGPFPFLDLTKKCNRFKGLFCIVVSVGKHSTFNLEEDFYWREARKESPYIFNIVSSHCGNSLRLGPKIIIAFHSAKGT